LPSFITASGANGLTFEIETSDLNDVRAYDISVIGAVPVEI
jgi:hypothetical protein